MDDLRNKKIEQVLFIGFLALAITLPLISWPGFLDGALAKNAFYFLVISLLFLVWLALSKTKGVLVDLKLYFILAFLGLVAVATVGSLQRSISVIGTYKHWEGAAAYIVLALTYFLALQVDWNEDKVRKILSVIVYVAAFISALAVAKFGYKILFAEGMGVADKARESLGGANAFSFYLTFMWPLALRLFLSPESTRKEKVLFGISSLLIFGANITTFGRTGWMISVFLFVIIMLLGANYRQKIVVAGFFVAFVFLAVFITQNQADTQVNFQKRFTSIFSSSSIAPRVAIWKTAAKLIINKPVIGSGPDTFQLAFPKYESIELARFTSKPKTPHNYPLTIGVTLGPLALVVLMLVFGTGIIEGFRSDYLRVSLSLSMVSALLVSLFLEWQVFLMFPFWLFMAINNRKKSLLKKPAVPLRLAFGLLAVALIFSAGLLTTADFYFQRGRRVQNREAKVAYFKRAAQINPYVYSYWREYFKITADRPMAERIELIKLIQSQHGLREEPLIAEAAMRWAARRSGKPQGVIELLDKAIALRPFSREAHYLKGRILIAQKKYEEAENELLLAESVRPSADNTKALLRARALKEKRRQQLEMPTY